MTLSAVMPFYTLVEGHGEVDAVPVLLSRLGHHLGVHIPWAAALRWKNLHLWEPARGGRGGLLQGLEFLRYRRDVGGVLVLRDEDDECPRRVAPGISTLIGNLDLPFRTAVTLLHPEYEVLFLPCMHRMQGLGFPTHARWAWRSGSERPRISASFGTPPAMRGHRSAMPAPCQCRLTGWT